MFDEIIFAIQSQGYNPVLAHPERYAYESNPSFFLRLKERNILMQLNLLAVSGYYGGAIQDLAGKYLDAGVYDFCGSDVHHSRHQQAMSRMIESRQEAVARLKDYPGFRNRELLDQ
jgi:protein-tyrosine phosphatase